MRPVNFVRRIEVYMPSPRDSLALMPAASRSSSLTVSFGSWFGGIVTELSRPEASHRRTRLAEFAWLLTLFIAVVDYLSGSEITLRFVYCLPLILAVLARGRASAATSGSLAPGSV